MSCTKTNTIADLIDKGYIKEGTREILNMQEFRLINDRYSQYAKDTYSIDRNDKLFSEELIERSNIRARTLMRAIPNESFFDEIDSKKVTLEEPVIEQSQNNLVSLPKPTLDFSYLSNQELVNSSDPVANKQIQDQIKEDAKELDDLINCLWAK